MEIVMITIRDPLNVVSHWRATAIEQLMFFAGGGPPRRREYENMTESALADAWRAAFGDPYDGQIGAKPAVSGTDRK
jgi:hypothetical protein